MPAEGFPVDQNTANRMISDAADDQATGMPPANEAINAANEMIPLPDATRASMVATHELQFEERAIPGQHGVHDGCRVIRVLQQRWVVAGTWPYAPLDDTNSEWRDVPCVRAK